MNSIAFAGFVLLLPVFGLMAWFAGSADEKFLMKAATCALGPLCIGGAPDVPILAGSSTASFVPFLIIVMGYVGVFFLLKFGVVTF